MRKTLFFAFISFIIIISLLAECFAGQPEPPKFPLSGPGGAEYKYASFDFEVFGEGAKKYYIFKPMGKAVEKHPVVVFFHGWGATNPKIYGAWIEHMVRRGYVVIFPCYQSGLSTPTRDFTSNGIDSVKDAIAGLKEICIVDKIAFVGHSAGAIIAANVAASYKFSALPVPAALMCVEPGKTSSRVKRAQMGLGDLSTLPAEMLLLCVSGEDDRVVQDFDAVKIYDSTRQIAAANKNLIVVRSDRHGLPALIADHFAPAARSCNQIFDSAAGKGGSRTKLTVKIGSAFSNRRASNVKNGMELDEEYSEKSGADLGNENALDYYGYWKLFDGLCDAVFYGKNRRFALGNTREQRFMGHWSDGTPVNELLIRK